MRRNLEKLKVETTAFAYRNGLVDQMYRTQEVLRMITDPAVAGALKTWHAHLGVFSRIRLRRPRRRRT